MDQRMDRPTKRGVESRRTQIKTRPDTRLPKLRAGGQGPYLGSLDHLGNSSDVTE